MNKTVRFKGIQEAFPPELRTQLIKAFEPFKEQQKSIQKAMQSTILPIKELQKTISTILPDFSGMKRAIDDINVNYIGITKLGEELKGIYNLEPTLFLETEVQKIDNIIEFKENYNHSLYYQGNDSEEYIINLGEEIKVDIEKEIYFNPVKMIEIDFNILPDDLKIITKKLIMRLESGCGISDFGGDFDDIWKNNNKQRKEKKLEPRSQHDFILNRVRNLKEMLNNKLKINNHISFIKSSRKTWRLIIR